MLLFNLLLVLFQCSVVIFTPRVGKRCLREPFGFCTNLTSLALRSVRTFTWEVGGGVLCSSASSSKMSCAKLSHTLALDLGSVSCSFKIGFMGNLVQRGYSTVYKYPQGWGGRQGEFILRILNSALLPPQGYGYACGYIR